MKKFEVFFGQVNQVRIEVTAQTKEEALKKAKKEWKDEYAFPYVVEVEETNEV